VQAQQKEGQYTIQKENIQQSVNAPWLRAQFSGANLKPGVAVERQNYASHAEPVLRAKYFLNS
jgi:hypothetical protein